MSQKLLETTVFLVKDMDENNRPYYQLTIGTDPDTRIIITDQEVENLLNDLPKFFYNIIHTHVLIEKPQMHQEEISS